MDETDGRKKSAWTDGSGYRYMRCVEHRGPRLPRSAGSVKRGFHAAACPGFARSASALRTSATRQRVCCGDTLMDKAP